tara:strand:- start:41165 stop:45289 length:4125 start_codon:yes stop_codon:yes gene_type:complete
MTRLSRITHSVAAYLAIVILIIAVLVTLARSLTPLLNQHKDVFEKWASQFVQAPVRVESVQASFQGFAPTFNFKNVTIESPHGHHRLFQLQRLSISVDILHSLLKRQFIASTILIGGIKVDLKQESDGLWRLNDQTIPRRQIDKMKHSTASKGQILSDRTRPVIAWLLAQRHIVLENFSLHWERPHKGDVILPNINVKLANNGDRHYLRGDAVLGLRTRTQFNLAVNVKGNVGHLKEMSGTAYVSAANLPFAHWLKNKYIAGLRVDKGHGDIKVWSDFGNGKLSDVQTEFSVHNTLVSAKEKSHHILFKQFSGDMEWQALADKGWQLTGNHLQIQTDKNQWPVNNLGIKMEAPNTDHAAQYFHLGHVNLSDVGIFIGQNKWLPQKLSQWWQRLQPQGDFENANFVHSGELKKLWEKPSSTTCLLGPARMNWLPSWVPLATNSVLVMPQSCVTSQLDALPRLFANVSFSHLSTSTWKYLPGVKNLSGQLLWRPGETHLTIASQNGAVNIPSLFNHRLQFTQLNADATLQYHADTWLLQFKQLNFANHYVQSQTQARISSEINKPAYINWQTAFHQENTHRINNLFPAKIMSAKLADWLTHAFIAGKDETGLMVMRGSTADFPFTNNKGIFLVDAQLNDVTLNYAPDWPYIDNLNARLLFHNNKMNVVAQSGNIFGQPIISTTASIADLSGQDSALIVKSKLDLDANAALAFVQESPLQKTLSGLKSLDMQGATKLALQLNIPLGKQKDPVAVDGQLQLINNQLKIPERNLQINNLNGQLHFTADGVSSNTLHARFFQQPATLVLSTKQTKNKKSFLQVDVNSRVDFKHLSEHFGIPIPPYIKGSFAYDAIIRMPNDGGDNQLELNTNFQGVTLDLPKPYAKLASVKAPTRLVAEFTNDKTWMRFNYNKLIDAALILANDKTGTKMQSGEVSLGGRSANYQVKPGLLVSGYIPNVDWEYWRNYWAKNKGNTSSSQSTEQNLRLIKIVVGKLQGFHQTLYDPMLQIYHKNKAWHVGVDSSTIAGTFVYPDAFPRQPLGGQFSKLYMAKIPLTDKSSQKTQHAIELHPSDVPPMDMNVADFRYGKSKFGSVQLDVIPIDNGLKIQYLKIKSKLIDFGVTGEWTDKNGHNHTNIEGNAKFSDLGSALKDWNLNDNFAKGSGNINLALSWPDTPYNFTVKGLNGFANVDMKDGLIVNLGAGTDAKIGLGKIINILSVQSIAKHLTFNFDDVTSNGFSYDTFQGKYKMDDGVITTDNTQIAGSVAKLNITGNIDLPNKRLDLLLQVAPHVTSSIPIIATIFGGPLVGAATWLANEIISPGLDKAIGSTITLSGPWSNPQVKTLKDAAQQGKNDRHTTNKLSDLNNQALESAVDQQSKIKKD